MIHPSERWRFVQEIDDKGFYEDEMVIHHLTGLRAFRRSFSEKFSADKSAVQVVLDQMKLAARSQATMLPFVFVAENVNGRLTLVMELVEGQSVLDLVSRRTLSKPREWARFAIKLLNAMVEARKVGARFDRLSLAHMTLTPNGELHLTRRFPMGNISKQEIEHSEYLERLDMIRDGGVYTSKQPPDERTELRVLSEVLCKIASGSVKNTLNFLKNEVKANPTYHSSPLASVEREIAEIILQMNGSGEGDPIYSFDQLIRILGPIANPPKQERITPSPQGVATTPSQTPLPGGAIIPPSAIQSASPIPSTPPLDFRNGDDTISNPFETPQIVASQQPDKFPTPASSSGTPTPSPQLPPSSAVEEEINPYAAAPLSPPSPIPSNLSTNGSDSAFPGVTSPPQPTGEKVSKKLNLTFLLWGAIAVIALALIVGGAIFATSFFSSDKQNSPPVAEFVEQKLGTFKINEPVLLDGSLSRDLDEGDNLNYSWTLVRPAKASIIFTDPETNISKEALSFMTKSPKVTINFQNHGIHEIRLQVNDGQRYSQPVIQQVEITP